MKKKLKRPLDDDGFYESINATIDAGSHVEYLERVKEVYEKYIEVFNDVFSESVAKDTVYLFKITYELEKDVTRHIEILGDQSFDDLASLLILSMGWVNDHMHGFTLPIKREKRTSFTDVIPDYTFFAPWWDDDPHPTYKSDEICIYHLDYKKVTHLEFIFDFGDGHQFRIECAGIREYEEDDEYLDFPILVSSTGIPPEQYPQRY